MTKRDPYADMRFPSVGIYRAKLGELPPSTPLWQALTPREWLGAFPAPLAKEPGRRIPKGDVGRIPVNTLLGKRKAA